MKKDFEKDLLAWSNFAVHEYNRKELKRIKERYENGEIQMSDAILTIYNLVDNDIQWVLEILQHLKAGEKEEIPFFNQDVAKSGFLRFWMQLSKNNRVEFYKESISTGDSRLMRKIPEKFPKSYLNLRDVLNQILSAEK